MYSLERQLGDRQVGRYECMGLRGSQVLARQVLARQVGASQVGASEVARCQLGRYIDMQLGHASKVGSQVLARQVYRYVARSCQQGRQLGSSQVGGSQVGRCQLGRSLRGSQVDIQIGSQVMLERQVARCYRDRYTCSSNVGGISHTQSNQQPHDAMYPARTQKYATTATINIVNDS